MTKQHPPLLDRFGRKHTYLRISLTEKCNLKCTYCRPELNDFYSPRQQIMSATEIVALSKTFVNLGIEKIRLTGGEPLVRKDLALILKQLSELPVELALTTNGIMIDKHLTLLQECGITSINVSLDTLDRDKFISIARKDHFERVFKNIQVLIALGIKVKVNAVLIKGMNDAEILDFIELTRNLPIAIRFIEFMPFDGNKWDLEKMIPLSAVLQVAASKYGAESILPGEQKLNDTVKNFTIEGFKGTFGVISTVSEPFCDSCNRVRITANGHLKNCLFSEGETDLLTPLRAGEDIVPLIQQSIASKKEIRGGKPDLDNFADPSAHQSNRSMIAIGG